MGSFKQHIAGAALTGTACGSASFYFYNSSIEDSIASGLICLIGGLIPDIDSPSSKPSDFIIRIASVLVPIFALQSLHYSALTPTRILIIAIIAYLFAIYGIRELFKRFTNHRGIFHSIPMALIWGGVVFLAFHISPLKTEIIMSASAIAGFLTHLIIDEMFSLVDISGGKFTPKKSLGSALKFFSISVPVNILAYLILAIIAYFCAVKAGYLHKYF